MVVTVGFTFTLAPLKLPGFQVYDRAPEEVRLLKPAGQTAVGEAAALSVGPFRTFKEIVAVELQPAVRPVTVYVVESVGLTLTGVPEKFPGFQVYETAPVALSVAEFPTQILEGLTAGNTVGFGTTLTATVRWEIQPNAFAPIMVYVVLERGVKLLMAPVKPPGFQV